MLDSAPVRQIARALIPTAAAALLGATLACGRTPTAPLVRTLTISKILAFGDSLTEGDATPFAFSPFSIRPTPSAGNPKGYPYKLLELLNQRYPNQTIMVYNGGMGGQPVESDANGVGRTLDEFLDAFSPEVMILMHGANDLNQETNPLPNVRTIANFAGVLVAKARARGVSVIVSGLPPRLAGGTPDRAKNPQLVVPFNAALEAMAAQNGAAYVDVYREIVQNLAGPDMAPDGLHLTQAGNDKLAAAYLSALTLRYETVK